MDKQSLKEISTSFSLLANTCTCPHYYEDSINCPHLSNILTIKSKGSKKHIFYQANHETLTNPKVHLLISQFPSRSYAY